MILRNILKKIKNMTNKLKIIILAAGYGTRLENDIRNSTDEELKKKLSGLPKPLLPIGGESLILRWMKILEGCSDSIDSEVVVVVNQKYYQLFEDWSRVYIGRGQESPSKLTLRLVNNGSLSNETRLGAVQDIALGIKEGGVVGQSVIVIAGDTLYPEKDFDLKKVISFFESSEGSTVIACPVEELEVSKRGIIEIEDGDSRVTSFLEKPKPEETESRLQCPAFYILNESSISLLNIFIAESKDKPLSLRDAPGFFLAYLITRAKVYAYKISGRFDVGGLESYIECDKAFSS